MDGFTLKFESLLNQLFSWSPKLIGAIVVLVVGLMIINLLTKMITKALEKAGLDKDVVPFLVSLLTVLFKVLLILSVAGILGIETTSFIALIGAVGLAIGMALQGTLGHFASGVMLLIFKPYKVGDLVEIQGQIGTVDEIQVFNTVLTSVDHKKVIIPNGIATSGIMTNLSANNLLRVDLHAAMPYEEDFNIVQNIILNVLKNNPKVLKDPAPVVEIEKFGDHSVHLVVRPYSTTADYWDVYFESYRDIKAALGAARIKVAYPKMEMPSA